MGYRIGKCGCCGQFTCNCLLMLVVEQTGSAGGQALHDISHTDALGDTPVDTTPKALVLGGSTGRCAAVITALQTTYGADNVYDHRVFGEPPPDGYCILHCDSTQTGEFNDAAILGANKPSGRVQFNSDEDFSSLTFSLYRCADPPGACTKLPAFTNPTAQQGAMGADCGHCNIDYPFPGPNGFDYATIDRDVFNHRTLALVQKKTGPHYSIFKIFDVDACGFNCNFWLFSDDPFVTGINEAYSASSINGCCYIPGTRDCNYNLSIAWDDLLADCANNGGADMVVNLDFGLTVTVSAAFAERRTQCYSWSGCMTYEEGVLAIIDVYNSCNPPPPPPGPLTCTGGALTLTFNKPVCLVDIPIQPGDFSFHNDLYVHTNVGNINGQPMSGSSCVPSIATCFMVSVYSSAKNISSITIGFADNSCFGVGGIGIII